MTFSDRVEQEAAKFYDKYQDADEWTEAFDNAVRFAKSLNDCTGYDQLKKELLKFITEAANGEWS
jgi:hypothetical protein